MTAIPGIGRRISKCVAAPPSAPVRRSLRLCLPPRRIALSRSARNPPPPPPPSIVLKKAEVDLNKRAGEVTADEIERVVGILQNPKAFHIPDWMVNRRKDKFDGKTFHMVSNQIATKIREDLEALKKVRAHRGLRHYWGIKVRGQHTGTTGRGRSHALAAAAQGK